jgi:hypothetical protein
VLANWAVHVDEPWERRVGGWLDGTGCDAWVVERERLDPAQYVELWLDDAGLKGEADYRHRYETWLDWFDAHAVEAVGMGWISARRTDRSQPALSIESWPYEIDQPIGREVSASARRVEALSAIDDAALAGLRLVLADGVVEERSGHPGDADPSTIVLRSQRCMRRARRLTTAEAAFAGACDGELSVGQIAAAVATLLDVDKPALEAETVALARELVLEGFLELP